MAKEEKKVEMSQEQLTEIMSRLNTLEVENANKDAKIAGLTESLAVGAPAVGETPLRQKKTFEPTFRTCRLKKVPFGGDPEDMRFVIGWTNRGSYQKLDKSVEPHEVRDFMQVYLYGGELIEGKMPVYEVKTLDLYNASGVVCKIEKEEVKKTKVATGEVIPCTVYDPKHGTVMTGETVDGWIEQSVTTLTLRVPGIAEPVIIDGKFANICG